MKIVREMGYTHADFFRLLPNAMGHHQYITKDSSVECPLATGKLTITLGPESVRRLVLVEIPCTRIVFEFENVPEQDRENFLHYFNLRFMKGLG